MLLPHVHTSLHALLSLPAPHASPLESASSPNPNQVGIALCAGTYDDRPTEEQVLIISLHLPASPCISLYLPISP